MSDVWNHMAKSELNWLNSQGLKFSIPAVRQHRHISWTQLNYSSGGLASYISTPSWGKASSVAHFITFTSGSFQSCLELEAISFLPLFRVSVQIASAGHAPLKKNFDRREYCPKAFVSFFFGQNCRKDSGSCRGISLIALNFGYILRARRKISLVKIRNELCPARVDCDYSCLTAPVINLTLLINPSK